MFLIRLKAIYHFLELILDYSGRLFLILPLLLLLTQFAIVVMVYVFGTSLIAAQESLAYINGLLFLGSVGYTSLKEGHVRVDIFYARFGKQTQAHVALWGNLLLGLPFLGFFWSVSLPYVADSWANLEGSVEASGLPFVYILKSMLLCFALSLNISMVSDILRAIYHLRRHEPDVS